MSRHRPWYHLKSKTLRLITRIQQEQTGDNNSPANTKGVIMKISNPEEYMILTTYKYEEA